MSTTKPPKISLDKLGVDVDDLLSKGTAIHKYADPIEGAKRNLTPAHVREVYAEDPGLLYIELRRKPKKRKSTKKKKAKKGGLLGWLK